MDVTLFCPFSIIPAEITACVATKLKRVPLKSFRICSKEIYNIATPFFYALSLPQREATLIMLSRGSIHPIKNWLWENITTVNFSARMEQKYLEHLEGCKALEKIEIRTPLNELQFENIIRSVTCTTLTSFEIFVSNLQDEVDLGDKGVELLSRFTSLSSLNLNNFKKLNDNQVAYIVKTFTSLTQINLGGCTQINPSSIGKFENCTSLNTIHLNGCPNIDDKGFSSIFSKPWGLIKINLANTKIGDEGIKTLVHMCTQIQVIHLDECPITDIALNAIVDNCPNVVQITLSGCDKINDAALLALSKCFQLKNMDLCLTKITSETFKKIIESCKNLKDVDIRTTRVDRKTIDEILGNRPEINILFHTNF